MSIPAYAHVQEHDDEGLGPRVSGERHAAFGSPADARRFVAVVAAERVVALEPAGVPVTPLYDEHPRTPRTLWGRLGWNVTPICAAADRFDWNAGRVFRALRRQLGLSQDRISSACGIPQATVSDWERGHARIPRAAVPGLSTAFGISEADLMRKLAPGEPCAGRD